MRVEKYTESYIYNWAMSDALNYMVFYTNKLQLLKATIESVKLSLCVNGIKPRYMYICWL